MNYQHNFTMGDEDQPKPEVEPGKAPKEYPEPNNPTEVPKDPSPPEVPTKRPAEAPPEKPVRPAKG